MLHHTALDQWLSCCFQSIARSPWISYLSNEEVQGEIHVLASPIFPPIGFSPGSLETTHPRFPYPAWRQVGPWRQAPLFFSFLYTSTYFSILPSRGGFYNPHSFVSNYALRPPRTTFIVRGDRVNSDESTRYNAHITPYNGHYTHRWRVRIWLKG